MDYLKEKGPQYRNRISLSEDWEVKSWTKSLCACVNELKQMVEKVGHSVHKVKGYLHNHNLKHSLEQ
ncbi:MAG: DUF3606 domain-containing protein [Bacteroidota bacterium]